MAIHKLQVFLASRFDEFRELRAALRKHIDDIRYPRVESIDLNDNLPDPNPPITRCYEGVDGAELFVLLVGEQYGSEVTDGRSYTHLEYLRAEEQRKPILAFLVGSSYAASMSYQPADPKMQSWIEELYRRKCASRLDPQRGWNELAVQISSRVRDQLWEIFTTTSYTEFHDDEDLLLLRENSLITIEQLTEPINRADRALHPLRSLAADHSAEAFNALAINLTGIAIHHLKMAHELVQMEIVPAYWLALLLITTGDYKGGGRIASLCATVASKRADAPKFAAMAALILAARASERLQNREDARKHATAAHENTPYHWLGKIELGRQLALDGNADEALRYADEAFWLRPVSILELQRDSAWRRLGARFDRFRRELRQAVNSETESIQHLEASVQDFARTLTVGDDVPQAMIERDASLLRLVDIARQSARHTLELLQRCARRLAADAASFEGIGFTGLTRHTREQIQTSVDVEIATSAALQSDLTRSRETAEEAKARTIRIAAIGFPAAAIVVLIALIAGAENEWSSVAACVVGLIVVIGAFWARGNASWTSHLEASQNSRQLEARLKQSTTALTDGIAARKNYDDRAALLGGQLERFCTLVVLFEKRAANRLPFAPAVSKERSMTNDVVRIPESRSDEDVEIKRVRELLPPELMDLGVTASLPTSHYWLARRIKSGTEEVFSRTATYFAA